MNRPSTAACVAAAAVFAAIAIFGIVPLIPQAALAQERDARDSAGAADRWEYLSITHTAWHNLFEFVSPDRRGEKLPLDDLARRLEVRRSQGEDRDLDVTDVLNHLGNQGWELVSFTAWSYADGGAEKRWYLKRQKR